jgi:uncharacterized membrane protein YraQ (UPF0718 family)
MKMAPRNIVKYVVAMMFVAGVFLSWRFGFAPGIAAGRSFRDFMLEMAAFLPLMFILVGLIDVWLPRSVIERHVGSGAGIWGSVWVILLAMLQAGPLYGAFPVAQLLWKKGCSTRNIFIYLGAFATIKVPMLTFEIGFLGLRFSLLRTLITLPVFIAIAVVMEAVLKAKGFVVLDPANEGRE